MSRRASSARKPFDRRASIFALSNDDEQGVELAAADPEDVLDPQNWPPVRKRLVFLALMSSSLLCDG
jgi:hypothetical protein